MYIKKHGLCRKHYYRMREDTLPRCSFNECVKAGVSDGLCQAHRMQRSSGRGMRPLRNVDRLPDGLPIAERVLARSALDGESGCRVWHGALGPGGYGTLTNEHGLPEGAHRASFRSVNGDIPGGMVIHHKCANRLCINPEHLQMVTPIENTAEMFERNFYRKRIEDLEKALRRHSPGHPLLIEDGVHRMPVRNDV